MPTLIEHVQSYLIEEGLGRDPQTPATTTPALEPTLWLARREGAPAPHDTKVAPVERNPDLVVNITQVGGIAPQRHEGFMRIDAVQLMVRAWKEPYAQEWEQRLRNALNDKRGWTMAALDVNESLLFKTLQPIGSGPEGYDFTTEYLFWLWQPPSPGP